MTMANAKTAEPARHGFDVMGRHMHPGPSRSSAAPAAHSRYQVPQPPTAPAYYLGRPAWVRIATSRPARLPTKEGLNLVMPGRVSRHQVRARGEAVT